MGTGGFRRALLLGGSTIGVLAGLNAAFAQQSETELAPVVVQGGVKKVKKAADPKSDTPLATQTTADEIAKKEITDISDLGNTTEPGVDYVESRPGAAGGMYVRGLSGPRIATLIDDIPIPYLDTQTRSGSMSPTTGISDSSNSFDFGSLGALDVMRGADSSRIGSGALAGALVMRTLEPEDLIEAGRNWGAIAKIGYDSRDRGVRGSVAGAARFDATSVLFQGGYRKAHETRNKGEDDIIGSARTKPNPSDIDQNNLLFKLRHDFEGGHRVGFTAERFDLQNDIDLKTLQNGATYRPGYYFGFDDTKRERVSVDYQYEAPASGGLFDAARLTGYWQRLTKNAGSNATRFASGAPDAASWAYDRENLTRESSVGLTGGSISRFSTGGLDHTVSFGGNLNAFRYNQLVTSIGGASSGTSTVTASQADVPNVEGTQLGLYVDDKLSFAESRFSLTPGLRFDWHEYRPTLSGEFEDNTGFGYFGLPKKHSGSRLSPKLLAEYQATEELKLFGQWSMAYRAPTVTELYSNFTNVAGGYTVLGNPNLKAETSNGVEIGAAYEAPGFSARATVFHNRYRNFINATEYYTDEFPAGYFPEFLVNSWENLDKVAISGVELKARKEFDNGLFVHGSLAYAYGKDKGNNVVLRTVAPIKSVLGVGYARENWGTELTGIFVGKMRDDGDPDTFDAPGYAVANLEAWWEPEQVKGMRLQAGVYNIFDKTYYNALAVRDINPNSVGSTNQPIKYYSEPGRNFRLSLTQKF